MRRTSRFGHLNLVWERSGGQKYGRVQNFCNSKLGYRTRTYTGRASVEASLSKKAVPYAIAGLVLLTCVSGICTLKEQRAEHNHPLDEKAFSPFSLDLKEQVSATSSIFELRPLFGHAPKPTLQGLVNSPSPNPSDQYVQTPGRKWHSILGQYEQAWRQGLWSVMVKQPLMQIERAYTPLPLTFTQDYDPEEKHTSEQLRLFIRHERGEVSTYLDLLPNCATVFLRGPSIQYRVPESVDEVLFLAGGTGIAPALQLAHILFRIRGVRGEGLPKLHILWANRKREDCKGVSDSAKDTGNIFSFWARSSHSTLSEHPQKNPLVQELDSLKARFPENVSISYFVDEERTSITDAIIKRHLNYTATNRPFHNRWGDSQVQTVDEARKKLIIVSGPDGFVEYLAGPKRSRNGAEVGGVPGGRMAAMNLQGWEVCKL
ncbi:MAG: mitochondrial Homoaconitase [Icmadophila ericetorum]|nr:mitochondrial Homoaconitase [Icmadophila ericetorum]